MTLPEGTCPVTGLAVARRDHWESIPLTGSLKVSFCIVGGRILLSQIKGQASDKGLISFLQHRQRILSETGLEHGHVEIIDHALYKGPLSRTIRSVLMELIVDEFTAGRLKGFWIFNTSASMRWFCLTRGSRYALGSVKTYKEAVTRALAVLDTVPAPGVGKVLQSLENLHIAELLDHIQGINWSALGTVREDVAPDHPLKQVFSAIGVLKQTIDDLMEKNQQTARELEEARQGAEEQSAKLKVLNEYLLDAEERERRNVAEDLHDTVTRTLASGISKLKTAREEGCETCSNQSMSEILKLLELSMRHVRAIIYQLSPPILHDFDLDIALGWLAEDMMQNYDIVIVYTNNIQGELVLGETIKEVLFRAVRELLMNAIKHSGAGRAALAIGREADRIWITVEDQGRGFDILNTGTGKISGFGLYSISERLRLLDADIRIESRVNNGTRVFLAAPITDSGPQPDQAV
ncbi:MAG: ATP-binding protein [Pseudomonadota bacterium]